MMNYKLLIERANRYFEALLMPLAIVLFGLSIYFDRMTDKLLVAGFSVAAVILSYLAEINRKVSKDE